MSLDLMNRLWWRDDLPTMEKFVAMAIADAASDDGLAWPAVKTIAHKCSCSERTVQNAIKALCGKQLLRKRDRPDQSSYYVFNIDAMPLIERPRRRKERLPGDSGRIIEEQDADLFATGAGDSPLDLGRVNLTTGTGAGDSMTGESPAPRTVIEPSIEPKDSGDLKSPAEPIAVLVEREWNKLVDAEPGIARVRKIDADLAKKLGDLGRKQALDGQSPGEAWLELISAVRRSTFLCGRAPPGRDRTAPFRLSLGWAAEPKHFREILGGKYDDDDRTRGTTTELATGRRLGPTEQALAGTFKRIRAAREWGRGSGDSGTDASRIGQ